MTDINMLLFLSRTMRYYQWFCHALPPCYISFKWVTQTQINFQKCLTICEGSIIQNFAWLHYHEFTFRNFTLRFFKKFYSYITKLSCFITLSWLYIWCTVFEFFSTMFFSSFESDLSRVWLFKSWMQGFISFMFVFFFSYIKRMMQKSHWKTLILIYGQK